MQLTDILHALLFVAETPLNIETLVEISGASTEEVEHALQTLQQSLAQSGSIQLVKIAGGYQLATKPEYLFYLSRLLNPPPKPLSRAALEVLAIIAYEQPITQTQIDSLRGVDSSHVVRQLIGRGLIQEMGRKETPGRPVLYGTTERFLHYFGLESLTQLPERPETSADS